MKKKVKPMGHCSVCGVATRGDICFKHLMAARRYSLAMAAGADAADRQMRAAGRLAWSKSDRDLAARVFNQASPEPRA